MRNAITAATTIVDGVGVLVAASDMQNILNIILLILSILGILVTMGFNLYDHIKKKDTKAITEDIKQATEDITKIQEGLKDESKTDKTK